MSFRPFTAPAFAVLVVLVASSENSAFVPTQNAATTRCRRSPLASSFLIKQGSSRPSFVRGRGRCTPLWAEHPGDATATVEAPPVGGFIDTELRGAAMRLHTTKQSPKEGEVKVEEPAEPYVPTRDDYLAFLVDSQHVYQAFEDVVNETPELAVFRNTGLERTEPLEIDIDFMLNEYGLARPAIGEKGESYANEIRRIQREGSIPEFICHYYNYYFAHTAGGRMIGKQMSALLLNKKTLEFYKWEGDLNKIKARVKDDIEEIAATWSREEKDECVSATMEAFRGGGGLNSYLSGGRSPH